MLTIAVIFVNYGPYHLARFEAFFHQCHLLQWQGVAIELARSQSEYTWEVNLEKYSFEIIAAIPNFPLEDVSKWETTSKLFNIISRIKPDVIVIAGYAEPAMIGALFWSYLNRKPAVLMSDSKEDDAPRSWKLESAKKFLLKLFKSALVGGKSHKQYLLKLGMISESIFDGYDVVNIEDFHPIRLQTFDRPLEAPFFLSINRFIPKKNLFFLLEAYANYTNIMGSQSWNLVLVGDGELRPQIEQHISILNIKHVVHLPGFLQQEELLPYFAHARCFIHASLQEQWGLVVNEAMASGLPVLVSNRCGCFSDLVIDGINGFGFDPENIQELTHLMLEVSSGSIDLQAMGQASLKHIQKFSPSYFADNLVRAIEYALNHS